MIGIRATGLEPAISPGKESVLETAASTIFATPVCQVPGSSKCRSPVSCCRPTLNGGPRILYNSGFFLRTRAAVSPRYSVGSSNSNMPLAFCMGKVTDR